MEKLIYYRNRSLIVFWVLISQILIFIPLIIYLTHIKAKDIDVIILIAMFITIIGTVLFVYLNKKFENLAQEKYVTDPESAREQYFNNLKELN